MTRQTVSWIQQAEVVVTDVMQVQRLLELNGHVRDALIRLWVTSRATENG